MNPDILHSTMDATKWAESFVETVNQFGLDIDKELMVAWFANAIMTGYDNGRWAEEKRWLESDCNKVEEQQDSPALNITGMAHLHPGDVLVVHVETGRMPPHKVTAHLGKVKDLLQPIIPTEYKLLLVPMREGAPTVNFNSITFEENRKQSDLEPKELKVASVAIPEGTIQAFDKARII